MLTLMTIAAEPRCDSPTARPYGVRIIDRYILREFAPFFVLALGTTTFVLLLDKLLKYATFIAGNGLDLLTFVRMLGYTLATVSGLVLPIALLIGSILTWNRLSTDSEYVVLKAAGVSLYRLLMPLLLVSVLLYGVAGVALMYGTPWGFQGIRRLTFEVARRQVSYHLQAQQFHEAFHGLVLYVARVHPERRQLEEVFIADRTVYPPQVITARTAELIPRSEVLQVILRLHQGTIHRYTPAGQRYYVAHFGQYDVVLELDTEAARRARRTSRPRELFPSQLRQEIARHTSESATYRRLRLFHYQLYALPFACVVFAGLGPVLGLVHTRSGRAGGYILGLLAVFVYYLFLTASNTLGEEAAFSPLLAAWLPNICMGVVTWLLLRRTAQGTVQWDLSALTAWCRQRWRRR
jgi:LPS export ABC transporter permease LptF